MVFRKKSNATKEKMAEPKDETNTAFVKNITWRHYMFFIIHMIQSVGSSIGFPVMSQFFYAKLNKQYFAEHNITITSNTSHHRLGKCFVNTSSPEYLLQQKVQAINAQWSQYFTIAHSIPTIIMVILGGSWVDVIGRKYISLLNMSSHIPKYVVYCLFMKFELPTAFLLIGYFFEGFGGSFYLSILVNVAYTSDLTPKNHKRALFLVAVQNLYHILWGMSHLASGYFIRELGFFWPLIFAICVNVVSIILFAAIVPETIKRGKLSDCSPWKTVKRVTTFYVKKKQGHNRNRMQFWLCLLAFAALSQSVMGEFSLDTLFVLNSPFCWNPVKLGNFGAAMSFISPIVSLVTLRLMQCCLTDELIASLSLGFHMAKCLIKGFAKQDWMIYLSGIIGSPGLLSFAMIRTIVSHLTDPSEQGSVFAGLGTVEALCGMTSSVMLNTIYAHTLLWMKGFVFIVVAISCTVPAALLFALHFVTKKEKAKQSLEISLDTNTTSNPDPPSSSSLNSDEQPQPSLTLTPQHPQVNAAFEPDEKL